MKIVGTIVNKDMSLQGLLLKGKPSEFGYEGSKYLMKPFKLSEVKKLIKSKKIKDYKLNNKGNIEGVNKKLSDLPMYDSKGNFIDKRIEIHSSIEDNGDLVGAVIFFPATGQEKKLKLDDLSMVYEYCEPTNFTLRNRDNSYYITGKGDTKKEDIPVIEKKSMPSSQNKVEKSIVGSEKVVSMKGEKSNIEYIPFKITQKNRHLIGYKDAKNEELVIPETFEHDGKYYKVNSIGREAFKNCTGLTSVVISNSIISIGDFAFRGCSSLTSVDLGNGVTSIGNYAFNNCSGLTSIVLGNGVISIGAGAFCGCSGLTSVVIPDSVTSIGSDFFRDCTSLISVTIPDSVTSIGDSVFSHCGSLTSVVIPDGVPSLGTWSFYGCSGLTSVVIPDSVTSIGNFAFADCSSLTSIVIPDSVTSIGQSAFRGCSSLTSVVIPDSVTSIGDAAFRDCTGLTSVVIPDSVTSIGVYAFYECESLTSIVIPNSVTSIGESAFNNCKNLSTIYYKGSKSEWCKIKKGENWKQNVGSDVSNGCKIVYNYKG